MTSWRTANNRKRGRAAKQRLQPWQKDVAGLLSRSLGTIALHMRPVNRSLGRTSHALDALRYAMRDTQKNAGKGTNYMMITYVLFFQSLALLTAMGLNLWTAYELRKLAELMRDVAQASPHVHLNFEGVPDAPKPN